MRALRRENTHLALSSQNVFTVVFTVHAFICTCSSSEAFRLLQGYTMVFQRAVRCGTCLLIHPLATTTILADCIKNLLQVEASPRNGKADAKQTVIAVVMGAFGILLLACCQWSLDRVRYVFTYCNGMDVVDIESIAREIWHAHVQSHFKLSMMHWACDQTFCIQVLAPAISAIAASPWASDHFAL